ncbi:NUDIX hydrolase [Streptomyces sp. NPDC020875]|uniref:NUDIX hydrolase n=1 Tax=Streptomyces sp. NPDC020875 TaxID=3154898 RepID=UPI0033CD8E35
MTVTTDPPGLSGPVRVSLAVIVRERWTLVIRPRIIAGGPRWRFAGGKQEPGETPEQTAAREVREETGLTVAPVRRLGERLHPDTGTHLTYIACTVTHGTAYRASPREVAETTWISTTPAVLGTYLPGLYEPVHDYLVNAF